MEVYNCSNHPAVVLLSSTALLDNKGKNSISDPVTTDVARYFGVPNPSCGILSYTIVDPVNQVDLVEPLKSWITLTGTILSVS